MTTTPLRNQVLQNHEAADEAARNQVQLWGVVIFLGLLILGILLFVFLVLLPNLNRRSEYAMLLDTSRQELIIAQQAQLEAPGRLKTQLTAAEAQLDAAAKAFLNENESVVLINRLNVYAEATGAQIVNLQASPAVVTSIHTQRDYQFAVTGSIDELLQFLGRIDEVNLGGFVVNKVAINLDNSVATQPVDSAIISPTPPRYLLTMNVSIISSPYSTQMVLGPGQTIQRVGNVGDLPLAEVQRQVEVAWAARDWGEAIYLLEQVVQSVPENVSARTLLYRAHVNYGYSYLANRSYNSAKFEFEKALSILPDGHEARIELQQLANDSTLSHQVEDQLQSQLTQVKNAGNWEEAIRILRLIGAIDPSYGSLRQELSQAYRNYGDLLAQRGDQVRAAEQYNLAQYVVSDAPDASQAASIGQPTQTFTPAENTPAGTIQAQPTTP